MHNQMPSPCGKYGNPASFSRHVHRVVHSCTDAVASSAARTLSAMLWHTRPRTPRHFYESGGVLGLLVRYCIARVVFPSLLICLALIQCRGWQLVTRVNRFNAPMLHCNTGQASEPPALAPDNPVNQKFTESKSRAIRANHYSTAPRKSPKRKTCVSTCHWHGHS